jgi:peptidoglycan hydrolase-like protein with peptidoglycan-binding domain
VFAARVMVEPSSDPQYKDTNKLANVVLPGEPAYAAKLEAAAAVYDGDASTAPRVLRRGDRGADVVALQAALGIRADGDFGPATEAAVRLFQADRGLLVDGVVGAMTFMALP